MPRLTQSEIAEEAKWQATSDANTLAEANVIFSDKKRLKAAEVAANELADEAKDRFEAMLRVANKGKTVEGMKVLDNN